MAIHGFKSLHGQHRQQMAQLRDCVNRQALALEHTKLYLMVQLQRKRLRQHQSLKVYLKVLDPQHLAVDKKFKRIAAAFVAV